MNLLQQAFSHSVPQAIQRFPGSLKLLHWGQSLLYSRNRTIKRWVQVATAQFQGVLLYVGCGDCHYLFQLKQVRANRVIAIDRNADWLDFLSEGGTRMLVDVDHALGSIFLPIADCWFGQCANDIAIKLGARFCRSTCGDVERKWLDGLF